MNLCIPFYVVDTITQHKENGYAMSFQAYGNKHFYNYMHGEQMRSVINRKPQFTLYMCEYKHHAIIHFAKFSTQFNMSHCFYALY